jgi:hypothetical protein
MAERLAILEARIENLERELQDLKGVIGSMDSVPVKAKPSQKQKPAALPDDAPEKLLSWVGKSSLLPGISTLCFLLVFALVLRTLTDGGVLDKQLGSLFGMSYAALLIAFGWYKYHRGSALAPIFGLSGAVLMFTIVVETNAHFGSLPAAPAYLILVLTALAMAGISHYHSNALPILVGTVGLGIAAVSIDFPAPYFPHLAVVLLIANVLGALATRIKRCSWLRWVIFLLTAGMVQVWGVNLVMRLAREGEVASLAALGLNWYLPVVALFTLFYLASAAYAVARPGVERVYKFDLALPTVNVLWAYGAMFYVIRIWWDDFSMLALAGIVGAGVHLAVAYWLTLHRRERTTWANAFIVAGVLLLVKSLPILAGGFLPALPFLSLLALGLAVLSRSWRNGGLRFISYLLQIAVGTVLALTILGRHPGEAFLLSAFVTGTVSLCALMQFRWIRLNKAPAESSVFNAWDIKDRSATFVLAAALVSGFLLLRASLYQMLSGNTEALAAAFQGGQTVIINMAAAALLFFAYRRSNKEIRNIAVLVTIIGGARVFLIDFLNISGVPLVASVFTFGLTILAISFVLGRWQSAEKAPGAPVVALADPVESFEQGPAADADASG